MRDPSLRQSSSFLELMSNGKPKKPAVAASVEAVNEVAGLGAGPCCELCPDMFYPTPPLPPGSKPEGSIQSLFTALLETAASTNSAAMESELSAELAQTRIGWETMYNNAQGASCCKICPAQFFAPRSYADVMAFDDKAAPAKAPKGGTGGDCCRTCPMRMMESATLDTMDADNGDMQPEDVSAAASALVGYGAAEARNPANKRVYGA